MEKPQFPEEFDLFGDLLAQFHANSGIPTNSDELRSFLQQFHFSDDAERALNIVDSIVAVIHPTDLANMHDAADPKIRFKTLNRAYTLPKLVSGNYGEFQDFCDAAQAWSEDPQVVQLVAVNAE